MDVLQVLILALVQGVTEALPISSTAHLLLVSTLFGWGELDLSLEVALSSGSLVGILFYFRQTLGRMVCDVVSLRTTLESRLAYYLVIGTIPLALIGFLLQDFITARFHSIAVIAIMSIVFGIALGFADHFGKRQRQLADITLRDALWIGAMQVLAIVPGVSRSGITITTARVLGLSRQASLRFAFLLSIPPAILNNGWHGYQLLAMDTAINLQPLLIGFIVSAILSFLTLALLLKVIERLSFLPFVVYRVFLGLVLLSALG